MAGGRQVALFGEQLIRLLRDKWKGDSGAERLAQELFAALRDNIPLDVDGPLTITMTPPDLFPPAERATSGTFPINYPPATETDQKQQPVIIIVQGQSPDPNNPQDTNLPPPVGGQGTNPIIQVRRGDGSITDYKMTPTGITPTDPKTGKDLTPPATEGGGLSATTIASGSGTTYTGADSAALTLPNASSDATLAAGTTVLYSTVSGVNYIVNIPVWL